VAVNWKKLYRLYREERLTVRATDLCRKYGVSDATFYKSQPGDSISLR
jgi:hypothetical protein